MCCAAHRATFMPASASANSASRPAVTGPMVHTILVLRCQGASSSSVAVDAAPLPLPAAGVGVYSEAPRLAAPARYPPSREATHGAAACASAQVRGRRKAQRSRVS